MNHQEWLSRWQEGRIGFHKQEPHEALEAHWRALSVPANGRVLVPLCGKSLDMRWLAERGHEVLGIELVREAAEQFVAEGRGEVTRFRQDDFVCYRQGNIELWQGDFFHFSADETFSFSAFYDRAALIALPAATRQRYAFHLAQMMAPGTSGLLVSLTHGRGADVGPPFSVDDAEIERLFGPNFTLARLGTQHVDDGICETVWTMVRKGPEDDEALAVR
ncbi:thiopurine S-methyltransferase [Phytohalomonas tamaricis]|uniref:thiopurine S-methyltransferase n=1 Tax=Phytohalomonas tamaricis TaxID=2081032 RepID=UPI000D0AECB7|nr:thiopurine S-methyltransferase [Phytohalomonas tamaricis]